ncbi:hypothetical protein GCM10009591_23500 [Brachybacterium tyrofermentans]
MPRRVHARCETTIVILPALIPGSVRRRPAAVADGSVPIRRPGRRARGAESRRLRPGQRVCVGSPIQPSTNGARVVLS